MEAGHLHLRPGRTPALRCERPMIGAAAMQRLAEHRQVSLLPDLLAAVFALCASAQRATARRAVLAACGQAPAPAPREALQLGQDTAREQLQRWALDLPAALPVGDAPPDPRWLRDAPVLHPAASEDARTAAAEALPRWLEQRLFGLAPQAWLQRWRDDGPAWLSRWAASHDHPVAHWLRAVRDDARAFALPARALDLPAEGEPGWRALAASIENDQNFALHPTWHGRPAETGAWTRTRRTVPVHTLWDRLGARLADLAALAIDPTALAAGALTVGDGTGLAWTEMSRGLLVHWVRLETGTRDPRLARATIYRVIAPTEWNFHPEGALARALAAPGTTAAQARLAAAVMDPCIAFDVDAQVPHA